MHLINFRIKCVPFSPILGCFGRKLLKVLVEIYSSVIGEEGCLYTLRPGKKFVARANYTLVIKRNRKLVFCLLLPDSSSAKNN